MTTRVLLLIALIAVVGLLVVGCSDQGVQGSSVPFLPLDQDLYWTYQTTEYESSTKLRVNYNEEWYIPSAPADFRGHSTYSLEIRQIDSDQTQVRYLNWDDEGLKLFGTEWKYDIDPNTETFVYTPAQLLLTHNLYVGKQWSSTFDTTRLSASTRAPGIQTKNYEVLTLESVTVPAGTFNAYKVKSYYSDDEDHDYDYTWYAEGVGIVKYEDYYFYNEEWILSFWRELVSYGYD